ncbi:cell adhesion molecule DSCAM-like isoform X2 [Lineus longissimus]|uniref:cell adhesion molecule DSCAM-like isoform X2 n=1 Tax=Lineus longissimus TaxID=88925 RepID=UPI002B4CED88
MDYIITSVLLFVYSWVHAVHTAVGLQFVEEPSNEVIALDSSLWWHCRAVGTGTINYSWRFQDAFLTSSPSTGLTIFNNGTLFISKIAESDFGLYQCKAKDALTAILGKYATLKKAYMADEFKESPKTVKKIVANTVIFNCAIDSLPYPIISWELNNQPIKDGEVTMVTETRSQLTFASVDYDNAGTLRCLAKNTALQALKYSQTATLSVEGRPFLKIPPEPTTAVVGASVILHCLAIGVPEPLVRWSLQDSTSKLSNSSRYLLYPNGSLMILNIQLSDEGFYMCEARNTWGPNTKSVFLGVEGDHGKPSINCTSSDASILQGQNLALRCQASGNPRPVITWAKDRSDLPPGRTSFPYQGELKISNVQGVDSGTYICTATNSKGSAFRMIGVTVYSVPSFTATPKDTTTKEGDPVTLTCAATALPKQPRIVWKTPQSGSLSSQNATDGITITASGNLLISSVMEVHAGKYKCFAKNEFGTVAAEAFLTVYVKPSLTHAPADQKVAEGSSPMIPCNAKGYPNPVVTWSRYSQTQETPVINGAVFRIHSNGSLTINNVKQRHSGTYKCLARNSAGTAQDMMTLAVFVAPTFRYTPPRLIIKLGDNVILPCAALGDPVPTVSWQREGKPLILDLNMMIHANHSLSITKIVTSQLGEYTCVAQNELLSISATGSVQLKDIPVFVTRPTNTTVNMTHPTEIPCQAVARETPMYLWYTSDRDGSTGRLLQPGISQTGQGALATVSSNGTLKIKRTSQADEGWYVCVAKNSAGETKVAAFLNVQVPPQITSTNSPQKVSANQTVSLTCQSQGDPAPKLSWLSPSVPPTPIRSSSDYVLGGSFLQIVSVNVKEHFGRWLCVACNDLGCVNASVLLYVIGQPSLSVAESHANGTLLTITCKAVGLPVPSIKYFKDTVEITGTAVPNHRILASGSLEITSPAVTTSYSCLAVNVNGEDKKNFSVPTLPDPPSKPTISNIQSDSVTITWTDGLDNHSPITAYHVYSTLIGAAAKSKVKVEKSPAVLKGLLPYKSYQFEVQSENGVGPGLIGPLSDAVTMLEGAPGEPMNVAAVYGKNSISLSWLAPSQLNGDPVNIVYEVSHQVVNATSALITAFLDNKQRKEHIIKNLDRSLTYRVQVRAGNKLIQKWSKPVVIEKSLRETPPAESPRISESGVRVTGPDSVSLSWEALDMVYGVQGYIISYSPETGRRRKRATLQKKTTDSNVTLTGLESGTSYSLQVAGYNRYGTGPFSPRYSVTTNPGPLASTAALGLGALIGIIIGCVILVFVIIVVIVCCCIRQRKVKQKQMDLLYDTPSHGQQGKPRQLKIPKGMENHYYKDEPKQKPPKQAKQTKTFEPAVSHKKTKRASGFYDLTSAVYDNVGYYDTPDEYYPTNAVETSHKSQSVKINAKDSDVFFKRKPSVIEERWAVIYCAA